jgi:hypothetical protein
MAAMSPRGPQRGVRVGLLVALSSTAAPLVLEAEAESELSRDTKARHRRAAPPRSSWDDDDGDRSGRSSWSSRRSRRTRPDRGAEPASASDAATNASVGSRLALRGGAGEISLGVLLSFDRLQGTAGGRVVHQDGLGWGLTSDGAGYHRHEDSWTYVGLGYHATFTYAHLLEGYRPAGADFTSDFRYQTLEFDFGPRVMHRVPRVGLDVTWGVGMGGQLLHAFETFSDGAELDELLAAGFRIRPHLSVSTMSRSVFVDLGLNASFGAVSDYIDQYDSLIEGIEPIMATPYLRVGSLWPMKGGGLIGLNYGLEMIGGEFISTSLSHQVVFLVRGVAFWEPDTPDRGEMAERAPVPE